MITFHISLQPYVVTPRLNLLIENGSDEGSQHMVLCRNNKKYPLLSSNTPYYQELWIHIGIELCSHRAHLFCAFFVLPTTRKSER